MSAAPVRPDPPLLVPSSELSWLALTSDQAQILSCVVQENRANIKHRWSPGIWEGLSRSLEDIERVGGAYIRELPSTKIKHTIPPERPG